MFLSFAYGFYVDIPLISTFHITPSSELYKFADQNATDFDLAFKFIIPLGPSTSSGAGSGTHRGGVHARRALGALSEPPSAW